MRDPIQVLTSSLAALFLAASAYAGDQPATSANYNIRLGGVNILNTRSRHEDTIYAQLTVLVNNRVVRTVQWDGTCSDRSCAPGRDMNNGLHVFGLAVSSDTGPVGPTDRVTWSFQLINAGHPPSSQNYTDAANAAASAGCQSDPNNPNDNSGWICVAGRLAQVLVGWLVAPNCDGPIAADSVTMTGAQLLALTQSRPVPAAHKYSYGWSKHYPGVDSAAGCGSNSDYWVDVWIDRNMPRPSNVSRTASRQRTR
jgi:hypothetical protein